MFGNFEIDVAVNDPLASRGEATVAAKPVEVSQVYRFEQCIRELWVPKRRRHGKSVEESDIEKVAGSKVRRLVKYLGHDDMRKVTREHLEAYFDTQFADATIGTIRDHII